MDIQLNTIHTAGQLLVFTDKECPKKIKLNLYFSSSSGYLLAYIPIVILFEKTFLLQINMLSERRLCLTHKTIHSHEYATLILKHTLNMKLNAMPDVFQRKRRVKNKLKYSY